MTATEIPERDYQEDLEAQIISLRPEGDYKVRELARKVYYHLLENDPELLEGWQRNRVLAEISGEISRLQAQQLAASRRALKVVSDAAQAERKAEYQRNLKAWTDSGKQDPPPIVPPVPLAFSVYRDTSISVGGGVQRHLGELTKVDWRRLGVKAGAKSRKQDAFRRLCERMEREIPDNKKTSDVFSEENFLKIQSEYEVDVRDDQS